MSKFIHNYISENNGPTTIITFELTQNADHSWNCTTTFSHPLYDETVVSASAPNIAMAVEATCPETSKDWAHRYGLNHVRKTVLQTLQESGLSLIERCSHPSAANKIQVSTPTRSEIRNAA
jgi:hypothetical protein